MRRHSLLLLVAALALAFPVYDALTVKTAGSDVRLFRRYGERVLAGDVPYRDFTVEYPPAAFAPWLAAVPVRGGSPLAYARRFELLMGLAAAMGAALAVATAIRLGTTRRRVAVVAGVGIASPYVAGSFTLQRYDYWPALLVSLALFGLASGRPVLAGSGIGVGAAAKGWPLAVLPALLIAGARRRVTVATSAAVALAVLMLPAAVAAPGGLWNSITGQAARSLQIESLGGSLIVLRRAVASERLVPVMSRRSIVLVGSTGERLATAATVLAVAVIAVVTVLAYRRRPASGIDAWLAIRTAAATTVAVITFGRVLSPQFVVWLFPFTGLLLVSHRRLDQLGGALLLGAIGLTGLEFPGLYYDLWPHPSVYAAGVLVLRNLALVAAAATLAAAVAATPARERGG